MRTRPRRVEVVLTWREMRMAADAAVDQQLRHLMKNDEPSLPHPRDGGWLDPDEHGWQVGIEGVLPEFAVAKCLGLYWPGATNASHGGDVGRFEVRWTSRDDGSLIVKPKDPDDRPYILVVGGPKRFELVGWLDGKEAKQPQYWRDDVPIPAWFVRQHYLRELGEVLEDSQPPAYDDDDDTRPF